jgi:serine/threonine-protein kinase
MTLAPDFRFGPYVVVGLLGAGLCGEVYRCRDAVHGREVALKILRPESGQLEDSMVVQFHQEAAILGSFHHPNVVEVFDAGVEDGTHYIASEFLDGGTLSGPLPAHELAAVAAQAAAGIKAMHDAGIVHNDVKPLNLIVTTNGNVKIIDFGMAQQLTPEMAADPQQLAEWRTAVRLDQLALGLTLYELATGQAPFENPETARTLAWLLGSQLLPLPPETQSSMQSAVRLCAAEDDDHAGLLLTAMSVALSLAGAPFPIRGG